MIIKLLTLVFISSLLLWSQCVGVRQQLDSFDWSVVKKLDSENVGSFILSSHSDKTPLAFVAFYAPWCGHCKNLYEPFSEAATYFKKKGKSVVFGAVDCTEYPALASAQGVTGFPTMKLFYRETGDGVLYERARDSDEIIRYIEEKLTDKDGPLRSTSSDSWDSQSTTPQVVYYSKDSKKHPSAMRKLSRTLWKKLPFYHLTPSKNKKLLKKLSIEKYPGLLVTTPYTPSNSTKKKLPTLHHYKGSLYTYNELFNFCEKFLRLNQKVQLFEIKSSKSWKNKRLLEKRLVFIALVPGSASYSVANQEIQLLSYKKLQVLEEFSNASTPKLADYNKHFFFSWIDTEKALGALQSSFGTIDQGHANQILVVHLKKKTYKILLVPSWTREKLLNLLDDIKLGSIQMDNPYTNLPFTRNSTAGEPTPKFLSDDL